MTFTEIEHRYLSELALGRLATIGPGGQRGRGLEIRGTVEVLEVDQPLIDGFSTDVLRIHPRRIVAWNLDGPGTNHRDVG